MNLTKSDWYAIFLIIIVIAAIVLNEVGLGIISLFLLFPAVLLMHTLFGNNETGK